MKYQNYYLSIITFVFVTKFLYANRHKYQSKQLFSEKVDKQNCFQSLNKGKFSIKIPSDIDNFEQNLLIRFNIPKSLSGEYVYDYNKVIWKGDINPSSVIIKLPNFELSLSVTIVKALLLFDPLNFNPNTNHELLIITDVMNSPSPLYSNFKVYFSFKIQMIDEKDLIRLNSLLQKGKEELNNIREGKKDLEKKLKEINKEYLKLSKMNVTKFFDSILMNFTNFRDSNTINDSLSLNYTNLDFSNYNFDPKSIFEYVGYDLKAYELTKIKHPICRNKKEKIYMIHFDKILPITKEFSDKLLSIKTESDRKINEHINTKTKNNSDNIIQIDKYLVYKSSGKNNNHTHKPSIVADFVTPDNSVNSISSYSLWRNSLLPNSKNDHKIPYQINTIGINPNHKSSLNREIKKKFEMLQKMFSLLDEKYKVLKTKYNSLNYNNSKIIKKPCLKQNKFLRPNNTINKNSTNSCKNVTEIFQGPVHFNNFQNISYPDNFKIIDKINNLNGFKLPTVVKRENIGFDNGTILIFQTIMIDTKNKTTKELENQYENFHKTHMRMKPKNSTYLK